MSLQEKIQKRFSSELSLEEQAKLESEISKGFQDLAEECKNSNNPKEKQEENLQSLYESYNLVPKKFLSDHSLDSLLLGLNICTTNVYSRFYTLGADIITIQSKITKPASVDDVALVILSRFFENVSYKEALLFMRTANEQFPKNSQRKLLISNMHHVIFHNIEKKEVYYPELLPDILKNLNHSLKHYVKYKGRVDSKEGNVDQHHVNYVYGYENWMRDLLNKYFHSIKKQAEVSGSSWNKLLSIEDLYDSDINQKQIKQLSPPSEKLILHYCILFLMDILEGAGDASFLGKFQKPAVDAIIKDVINTLQAVNPSLVDYLVIYQKQLKLLQYDPSVKEVNKKNEDHLPFKSYSKYNIYNNSGVAYFAWNVFQDVSQTILLRKEFKLTLILPVLNQVLKEINEKDAIKKNLVSLVHAFSYGLKVKEPVENLNWLGIPIDEVLKSFLEFGGGNVSEEERVWTVNIFKSLVDVFSDQAQIKIFLSIIKKSTNNSLAGHVMDEFRSKFVHAMKKYDFLNPGPSPSPYTSLNVVKTFLDFSLKEENANSLFDKTDLISSGLNLLIFILIKFNNYLKTIDKSKSIENKSKELFSPQNAEFIIKYAKKASGFSQKLSEEIQGINSQTATFDKDHPNLDSLNARCNQMLMIKDAISRVEELVAELKTLTS